MEGYLTNNKTFERQESSFGIKAINQAIDMLKNSKSIY